MTKAGEHCASTGAAGAQQGRSPAEDAAQSGRGAAWRSMAQPGILLSRGEAR